jgi:HPt (histidine-containing phosphotransfer) domain-containing protein
MPSDDTALVLDTARLAALTDEIGDEALVRQAVAAFLEEAPDRLATIRIAAVGDDTDDLRSAAHALGSPAAMLGAVGVSTTARAIQTACTEGRDTDARAMVDELVDVTGRTGRAMRAYLDATRTL